MKYSGNVDNSQANGLGWSFLDNLYEIFKAKIVVIIILMFDTPGFE